MLLIYDNKDFFMKLSSVILRNAYSQC